MAKYLVETFYTCNLKVSHYLDNISDNELSNLEKNENGKFDILDIKLDTRKVKNLESKQSQDDQKINLIEKNLNNQKYLHYDNFQVLVLTKSFGYNLLKGNNPELKVEGSDKFIFKNFSFVWCIWTR